MYSLLPLHFVQKCQREKRNDPTQKEHNNEQSVNHLKAYIEGKAASYRQLDIQYKGILFFKVTFIAIFLFAGV